MTDAASDTGFSQSRSVEQRIPGGEVEEHSLPLTLKMSWGLGSFGVAVLSNSVGALVLFYLVKVTGMPAWLAGVFLTTARLFDAFFDPFVGHVSDRTTIRFGGRRRPYLLGGGVLCAVAMLLVFNVPFRGDTLAGGAYVLGALLLYGVAYSLFNVPYIAMPAEMTQGYHERSSIHGWRVIFSGIGIAVAGSGSGLLLAGLAHRRAQVGPQINTQGDYTVLAGLYAVLILLSLLATWRGTRGAAFTYRTLSPPAWRHQLSTFLQNKPFLTIMGVKALQLIGVSSNQAALFFMLVEVLKRSSADVALVGLPSVFVSILITPPLVRFSRRYGKKAGYLISAAFTGASYLSWSFAQIGEPSWVLVLRGAVLGVGFSGNVLFCMSMITDSIELDSFRTGMQREGLYTAFFSFVEKFTGALGPTLVGVALSAAGFTAKIKVTPENYAHVRQATLLGVSYVPGACALLAVLLLSRYRLDLIALRRARSASPEPAEPDIQG
jgi:GPH family glycoside/pentoside/hexuronide:cation symporter